MPDSSKRQSNRRRRARWWLAAVGVLIVALVVTAWALRDVPRQQLEQALGARLGARVDVGRIEIVSTEHVILHRVTISSPSVWPQAEQIRFETIEAEGSPRAMIDAEFRRLALRGGTVRLVDAAPVPEAAGGAAEEAPSARADELVLEGVSVRAGRGAGEVSVSGAFRDWGGAFAGRVEVRGERVSLPRFAAPLGGWPDNAPQVTLERFDARVLVDRPEAAGAMLRGTVDAGGFGRWRIEANCPPGGLEACEVAALGSEIDAHLVASLWQEDGAVARGSLVSLAVRRDATGAVEGRVALGLRDLPALTAEGRWTPADSGDGPGRLDATWRARAARLSEWVSGLAGAGVLDAREALEGAGHPEGLVDVRGELSGPVRAPRWSVEARLIGASAGAEDGPWDVRGGELEVSASGAWPLEAGTTFRAVISGRGRALELAPQPIEGSFEGSFDAGNASVRVESARWRVGDLLEMKGMVTGTWGGQVEASFSGEDIALVPLLDWALPASAKIDGWSLPGGRLAAEGTVRYAGGDEVEFLGSLTAEELEASREDGTRAMQGFSVQAGARGTLGAGTPGQIRGEVDLEGTIGGGVVLWDSLFADFGELEPSWTARASLAANEASVVDVALRSETGLRLDTRVTLDADGAAGIEGRLEAQELADAYRRWVLDPMAAGEVSEWPSIRRGRLAGDVSFQRASGSRPARVAGRVQLEGVHVAGSRDGWALEDVALSLPFEISVWDDGLAGGSREREGHVALSGGQVRGMSLSPVDSRLAVRGVGARVLEPLELSVAGGGVVLEDVSVTPGLGAPNEASAAVRLEGLDLEELTRAAGLPALSGTVDGSFPRVTFRGDSLDVEGASGLELFGGRVEIGGISVQEIGSGYPRMRFSASFEDIDLLQVTRTFSFGEMTGLVEGELTDCEVVGGVPTAFEFELRTTERRGVSRTVSVKAVNNLTIIGTGGSTSVLNRGLQRFFDKYTYDRIGIHARLENDRFVLRGLEHEGDRELFVSGRFPLPINIVNVNPGQAIGFRSMLDRLQRIDFSAAGSEEVD